MVLKILNLIGHTIFLALEQLAIIIIMRSNQTHFLFRWRGMAYPQFVILSSVNKFRHIENAEKFLTGLLIELYIVRVCSIFQMNENIVARKYLT